MKEQTCRFVQLPSHGTASFLPESGFLFVIYTPNLNFLGTDTFAFVANDGKIDSNVGTVTINVLPTVSINNVSVLEGVLLTRPATASQFPGVPL